MIGKLGDPNIGVQRMNESKLPGRPVVARSPLRISWKRKIVFTVVTTLLILLACEGAVRLRAWMKYGGTNPSDDSFLDYSQELGIVTPRPNYERHGNSSSVRINSLGFRGDDITLAKPPGTVRIVCVGASTTFCTGVSSNEAAWPRLLEKEISQKYPNTKWQVVNAGVPGYCMSQSLINLKRRVLPLDPDLVIFYEAHNQLANDTRELARERGVIQPDEDRTSPAVEFLSRYSLLFSLCHKNLRIVSAKSDSHQSKLNGLPPELPQKYVEAIGDMHRLLKEQNVPLVVSAFLVKYRRDQERSVQLANADVAAYYMPWMSMDDLLDGIDAYNKALVGYAHAHGVPVVEDTTSVPPDNKHFIDCVHFADAGSALMADRIFTFLQAKGILQQLQGTRRQAK